MTVRLVRAQQVVRTTEETMVVTSWFMGRMGDSDERRSPWWVRWRVAWYGGFEELLAVEAAVVDLTRLVRRAVGWLAVGVLGTLRVNPMEDQAAPCWR